MGNITIKEVAEKAGVSPSTISQFLNKRYHHMSEGTRSRIEAVIDELNFQPNIIARSLKVKKTNTIGIIVASVLYTYSTFLSRGVEDYCQHRGYNVIICNADNNPQKERKYIQMLRNKQVDGVIMAATGENLDFIQENILRGYPIVQIDRFFQALKTDIVQSDNFTGAFEAVEHLIKNNYKRIAIVLPEGKVISVRKERLEGYYSALRKYAIPIEDDLVKFASERNASKKIEELFQIKEPPNAIFATNDIMAIETLTFLKNRGIKVPQEIAMVSFDDVPMAHLLEPPLTVVAQPAYEIGRTAAELLISRIENKEKSFNPIKKVLPCKLIPRESCGEGGLK